MTSNVNIKYASYINSAKKDRRFPLEIVPKLSEEGILGCHINGYGSTKTSSAAYNLMMPKLERGDSRLRSFASVQSTLSMATIHKFFSKESVQYSKPIVARQQLIQAKLTLMLNEITKAPLIVWHLAKLKDEEKLTP